MIKKLAPFIEGYKKEAVLAPLLVVLEAICELVMPLIMANIIDFGINGNAGITYIVRSGAFMLVLAVISMYCGVSAAKYAANGSQGFGANLRQAMYNKVQDFSFADIDKFSSASLITRMTNDVNVIQMMLAMGLRIVTRSPVMLVAALIVCFSINAKLTVVLIIVVPVMGAAVGLLMKATHKLFERFQQKIDSLNDTVQENLIAIRVVKAFVRAGHEKTKFKRQTTS
jgi:ATP-binding cassette subfamily B protein